jgi:hypothetical protein
MKSFLVHIASLAVMVHMMFGCNMHHGLGSANACVNQNAISTCCSSVEGEPADDGHDHDCHEHGDHDTEFPESDSTFDADKSSHGHSHLCCQDDGCNVIKLAKFVYVPLDFSRVYLGGAENAAIAETSSYPGYSVNPFPECNCLAPKMRSHLLFAVQLI